jgi:hypothetical protein
MLTTSRFMAFAAVAGALTLAACGGSPDISPVAATTTGSGDGAVLTSSGNGPGGQPSPAPGTGTCTNECDGTSQGPGPGAGNGYGPGPANGGGTGNGYGPGPGDGLCGDACTGPVGPDPTYVGLALTLALQEEYGAENLYRGVLLQFGADTMPFAVIADSEARHVEALKLLFTRRPQMPLPPQPSANKTAFGSIPEACAAGVTAEQKDADFYTWYLQQTDLPQDVRNVFTNLQAASLYNHLPAFEACAN